jgi:hypothetical protein
VCATSALTQAGTSPGKEIEMNIHLINGARQVVVVAALIAPFASHASTIDPQTCKPVLSADSNVRLQEQAARGKTALRRFLTRTEGIYPLDRHAEMAKLEATEAEEHACEARNAKPAAPVIVAHKQSTDSGR